MLKLLSYLYSAVAFKVTPSVVLRKFGDFSDLRTCLFFETQKKSSFKLNENDVLTVGFVNTKSCF